MKYHYEIPQANLAKLKAIAKRNEVDTRIHPAISSSDGEFSAIGQAP